jgi:excisionase family DNA binding protein
MLYLLLLKLNGGKAMASEQQHEPITEKFVNLEDVATHLSLSKDAIRNFIKKESIPYYRVGKQYKFLISEVNEWVKSGKSSNIERGTNEI